MSTFAREYLSGSLASSTTAALFCPLECVKTRLQLQGTPGWKRVYTAGFLRALLDIWRQDGLLLLWSHGFAGLVARDFVYSGVRTGMYPRVRDAVAFGKPVGEASLLEKILAGVLCGGCGAAIANPLDVVRVRMTAEGGRVDPASGRLLSGLRVGELPRWSSSVHCLMDTAATDGAVRGLALRGVGPSASRAALLTGAQMSTYDHFKTYAKRASALREGTLLHVLGAAVSGLAATIACHPSDVVKSRVMAGRADATAGKPSAWGVVGKIWRHEGFLGFYRGFLPAYARIGPTIFLQLPLAEALRSAFGVRSF